MKPYFSHTCESEVEFPTWGCETVGNWLLTSNQFGFLAWQNTPDALTEILDKAYDAINQNSLTNAFLRFF